ncbi:MAG: PAS domain-containing protein [Paracoccaceae bacterium]
MSVEPAIRPEEKDTTEAFFAPDEIFFSRTDKRGVIQAGNSVFQRVAGYSWDELLGAPHKLVRHPDMPKGVFALFWNRLQKNRPMAAYVKNRTKDGRFYWVFAMIVPVNDGYISVRIKPQAEQFAQSRALYARLLDIEKAEGLDGETSAKRLLAIMDADGFPDYFTFICDAMISELQARDKNMGRPVGKRRHITSSLLEHTEEALGVTRDLLSGYGEITSEPTNMRILSARLEAAGGPISAISQNYELMSSDLMHLLTQLDVDGEDPFGRMKTEVQEVRLRLAICRAFNEATTEFNSEAGLHQAEEAANMRQIASRLEEEVVSGLNDIVVSAERLPAICVELRRQVTGLDVVRLLCRVEAGRLNVKDAGLNGIIDRLDRFHSELESQITRISEIARIITQDAKSLIVNHGTA